MSTTGSDNAATSAAHASSETNASNGMSVQTPALTEPRTEARESPGHRRDHGFEPILIGGCQRSGTTGLAVMFDRHSRVATLPETQFFNKFVHEDRKRQQPMTREALAERIVVDYFMRHAHLTAKEVVDGFDGAEPTYENAFRALLRAYAIKHDKPRPAEKSCAHLLYAESILASLPEARMICIMRDGRDVVRSLQNSPVGRGQSVEHHCFHWMKYARLVRRLQTELPKDRFTVVKYEDLMIEPERELRRLCEFVGEGFEPSQIDGGVRSDTVPEIEQGWKGKAKEGPDPSRVGAWRRCGDPGLIASMNYYMAPVLRDWGYPDCEVSDLTMTRRLVLGAKFLPYRPWVFGPLRMVRTGVRSVLGSRDGMSAAKDE